MLGRVRSLEKQLHSEDRLLNLNVSMPANKLSLDTVSQMATTGGSPRLTAPAPKLDGQGSGANSVHLLVCKKQILALKTELEAAKSRCTELENDVRRSNLQQWRIEKDAYYQEVLRLQAVIRMKDQEEKLRLANRPAAVQSAVQTDPITVNAYSDLALKQILSQRDPQLQVSFFSLFMPFHLIVSRTVTEMKLFSVRCPDICRNFPIFKIENIYDCADA